MLGDKMKKFHFLVLFGLTSCGTLQQMTDNINASTASIYYNAYAVQRSTAVIRENAALVDESTKQVVENRKHLEEAAK